MPSGRARPQHKAMYGLVVTPARTRARAACSGVLTHATPNTNGHDAAFMRHVSALEVFIGYAKRLPRMNNDDPHEAALGAFVMRQRAARRLLQVSRLQPGFEDTNASERAATRQARMEKVPLWSWGKPAKVRPSARPSACPPARPPAMHGAVAQGSPWLERP